MELVDNTGSRLNKNGSTVFKPMKLLSICCNLLAYPRATHKLTYEVSESTVWDLCVESHMMRWM